MIKSRSYSSSGFSLIEVLIAIAIIGLLISLAIPAIQASREAARRTQCINNQRQLGVAFLSFESRNKVFPASVTIALKGPLVGDPEVQIHNYMVDLLPFIEERGVNDQYHRDAIFCASENAAAIGTPLSVVMCPSAPRAESTAEYHFVPSLTVHSTTRTTLKSLFDKLDAKYSLTYIGGVTDYAVPIQVDRVLAAKLGFKDVSGPGLDSMFPSPLEQDSSKLKPKLLSVLTSPGVAQFSVQLRAAQITDGLSHTIMMTEVAGRPEHWQMGNHVMIGEPLESAWASPYIGMRINGVDVPGQKTKCVIQCDNNDEIYSFHPSGINFLFADGHVDTLHPDIDPRLLVTLITPNRGDNTE